MASPLDLHAACSRRTALARIGLGAATVVGPVLLGGCSWRTDVHKPAPRRREANADQPLLDKARGDQERLLALARATAAAHPAIVAVLTPLIAHHVEHVTVLGGRPTAGTTPSASPSASASASADGSSPLVPARAGAALSALARAEQAASTARVADTTVAVSGEFARVLSAIGAGDAQHVVVLNRASLARRAKASAS